MKTGLFFSILLMAQCCYAQDVGSLPIAFGEPGSVDFAERQRELLASEPFIKAGITPDALRKAFLYYQQRPTQRLMPITPELAKTFAELWQARHGHKLPRSQQKTGGEDNEPFDVLVRAAARAKKRESAQDRRAQTVRLGVVAFNTWGAERQLLDPNRKARIKIDPEKYWRYLHSQPGGQNFTLEQARVVIGRAIARISQYNIPTTVEKAQELARIFLRK